MAENLFSPICELATAATSSDYVHVAQIDFNNRIS